jgi:putative membrane protein
MFRYITLWLKGFCMGAADVVPGVSGGTMAFILGIYEELLPAIRSFNLTFFRLLLTFRLKEALGFTNWRFLAAVLFGILTAIFTLAGIIGRLLVNQPVFIWSFFFGLILASIYVVYTRIEQPTIFTGLISLVFAAGAYLLVGLVPVQTPEAPWFLFLSGAVAICAMILPGISGSFILVLLGKYHYVLDAVHHRDFLTLAIVAAGAVFGLLLFARFLTWLLSRYHDPTIAALCGLMAGSLRKVWPWKSLETFEAGIGQAAVILEKNMLPDRFGSEVLFAVILTLFGAAIVILIERAADASR